jgi:hypothetical protein
MTFARALADSDTSNPIFDLYKNSAIPDAFRALVLKMTPNQRIARRE